MYDFMRGIVYDYRLACGRIDVSRGRTAGSSVDGADPVPRGNGLIDLIRRETSSAHLPLHLSAIGEAGRRGVWLLRSRAARSARDGNRLVKWLASGLPASGVPVPTHLIIFGWLPPVNPRVQPFVEDGRYDIVL